MQFIVVPSVWVVGVCVLRKDVGCDILFCRLAAILGVGMVLGCLPHLVELLEKIVEFQFKENQLPSLMDSERAFLQTLSTCAGHTALLVANLMFDKLLKRN